MPDQKRNVPLLGPTGHLRTDMLQYGAGEAVVGKGNPQNTRKP
jgi:hypothetical protein